MTNARKILIVLGVLALAGVARTPFEKKVEQTLRAEQLLSEPLNISTRERIGQDSAAIALGGLRTLVAFAYNLRAFEYFEHQDWVRVEDTYETVVTLAPHTIYYWDTAAWQMATNAAGDIRDDESLSALRRDQLRKGYIEKGRSFLKRGIENNPDDWRLPASLGRLYSDQSKVPDYPEAYHWFSYAAERNAPEFIRHHALTSLIRIPGRGKDARVLLGQILANPRERVPTMLVLSFVFARQDGDTSTDLAKRIFGSEPQALQSLTNYLRREKEDFPMTGVKEEIARLQQPTSR